MRNRNKYIYTLTTCILLAGCGDDTNQGTGSKGVGGSTSSSGSAGAGGDGGMGTGGMGTGGMGGGSSIQIEKPEGAIPGQYMFVLDDTKVTGAMAKTVAEELLAPQSGTLLEVYDSGLIGFAANNLDDAKALAMAKDPRIIGISQDFALAIDETQSTPPNWGIDRIDDKALPLNNTFNYYFTGVGVNVYVIDSGINDKHSDFTGRTTHDLASDFIKDGAADCHGHGSHVAGIVGGTPSGVAKGVQLYSVRVFNCKGQTTASKVLSGINWVRANRKLPAVVNMSLGGPASTVMDNAVQGLLSVGVHVVASAGNAGTDACAFSPARVPGVITVGATNTSDTRPTWSNYGTCVDLFAPGDTIQSTNGLSNQASTFKSGTSQAAPHVAGVVAQVLETQPTLTPAQMHQLIIDGAVPNVVQDPKGSPNRLLYSRLNEPKSGFVGTKIWDNGYYTDGGLWLNPNQGSTIQYADINGDKMTDICGRAVNGIVCEVSTGMGFGPQQVWEGGYGDSNGWGATDNMYGTIRFPDLNGDGKADVCGRGPGGVYCGLSDGTKFVASPTTWDQPPHFTDANGYGNPVFWKTMQFPDVNGDGKADICARQAAGVVCGISTGTGFGPIQVWEGGYNDGSGWGGNENLWGTIRFPDINGDGKADVCGRGNAGIYCGISDGTKFVPGGLWDGGYYTDAGPWADPVYYRTIQYADINGDKSADICGRAVNGMVCELSMGTKFGPPVTWEPGFANVSGWAGSPNLWATIRLADINGDGMADVCGRANPGVACSLSTGTKFTFGAMWDVTFSDVAGWATQDTYWGTIRFPDINGDGKADVCGRSKNGVMCGLAP